MLAVKAAFAPQAGALPPSRSRKSLLVFGFWCLVFPPQAAVFGLPRPLVPPKLLLSERERLQAKAGVWRFLGSQQQANRPLIRFDLV